MKKWLAPCILLFALSAAMASPLFAAPAGAWTAPPDVLPGALSTQPATTAPSAALLATDPYRIKSPVNITQSLNSAREIIAPTRPGKYLLTAANFGMGYELWDLKTLAKERESSAKLDIDNLALSPDGQYLAGYQRSTAARGARGPMAITSTIEILSLHTGKSVRSIPAPEGASFGADVLGFAMPDLVLVAFRAGPETDLQIVEIPTGKLTGRIPVKRNFALKEFALSPTGKYLAIALAGNISLYQTSNGQLLGTIPFKPAAGDQFSADYVNWDFAESRLAFSADGQSLALVQTDRNKLHALIINAATGDVIEDQVTPATTPLDKSAALSWNPDGASLLWGTAVIERSTLSAVYQLPKRENLLYTRWADPSSVLMVFKAPAEPARGTPGARNLRGPTSIGSERLTFETVPVNKETLAKAAGTLAQGGKVEDTSLTPLTPVNLALAREINLDSAPASPWKAAPPDSPKPAKSIAASFSLKPPGTNAPSNDSPSAILFTSRDTHAAFFEHFAESTEFASHGQRAKTWIERRELTSGTVSSSVELPATYRALDASDSGKTLALRSGKEGDRIDIYTADKNTFKPLAAFRPFGIAKPAFSDISGNDDPNIIDFASLIDDSHLLVKSQGGTLVMLELPLGKPLWKMPLPAAATRLEHLWPTLSPDRHLAAIPAKNGLCLLNPLTGEPLNRLPSDATAAQASALAFSPDGTRLAALLNYTSQAFIDVYDLRTGQASSHFPINAPSGIERIVWLSPGYVLLSNPPFPASVVSLEHKLTLCQYIYTPMQFGSVMPFDKLFLGAPADSRGPASVAALTLPAADILQAAAAVKESDLYIWHPGLSVKLDITVTGDDAYRTQQLAQWTTALKSRGITVDDKSPNILRCNSFLMDGQPTTYKMNNGESVTLTQKLVGYTVSLTLGGAGGDKEIWKADFSKPPERSYSPAMIAVQIKPGESAQQAAERQNPQPKTASALVPPPMYIFKDRDIPLIRLSARPSDSPRGLPDRGRATTPPGRTGRINYP